MFVKCLPKILSYRFRFVAQCFTPMQFSYRFHSKFHFNLVASKY